MTWCLCSYCLVKGLVNEIGNVWRAWGQLLLGECVHHRRHCRWSFLLVGAATLRVIWLDVDLYYALSLESRQKNVRSWHFWTVCVLCQEVYSIGLVLASGVSVGLCLF